MNTAAIIIAGVVVVGMGALAIYTEYGGKDDEQTDHTEIRKDNGDAGDVPADAKRDDSKSTKHRKGGQ